MWLRRLQQTRIPCTRVIQGAYKGCGGTCERSREYSPHGADKLNGGGGAGTGVLAAPFTGLTSTGRGGAEVICTLQPFDVTSTRSPARSGTSINALAPSMPTGLPSIATWRSDGCSSTPTQMVKHARDSMPLLDTIKVRSFSFCIRAAPRACHPRPTIYT